MQSLLILELFQLMKKKKIKGKGLYSYLINESPTKTITKTNKKYFEQRPSTGILPNLTPQDHIIKQKQHGKHISKENYKNKGSLMGSACKVNDKKVSIELQRAQRKHLSHDLLHDHFDQSICPTISTTKKRAQKLHYSNIFNHETTQEISFISHLQNNFNIFDNQIIQEEEKPILPKGF